MQTYDCVVQLRDASGLTLTEVVRQGVTAPEVLLLRQGHGADGVVRLARGRTIRRSQAEERGRLASAYGAGRVAELFGPAHQPLPAALAGETAGAGEGSSGEA